MSTVPSPVKIKDLIFLNLHCHRKPSSYALMLSAIRCHASSLSLDALVVLDLAVKIPLSSSYNFKMSSCSLELKKCALSFFLTIWKSVGGKRTHVNNCNKTTVYFYSLILWFLTAVRVHWDQCFRVRLLSHGSSQRARAVIRDVSMLDLVIRSKPAVAGQNKMEFKLTRRRVLLNWQPVGETWRSERVNLRYKAGHQRALLTLDFLIQLKARSCDGGGAPRASRRKTRSVKIF